jgi:Chaperone of endosialidase
LEHFLSNTTGGGNTAVGGDALFLNTTGGGNTAIGTGALGNNTTGSGNIAVGNAAGHDLTTGSQNIIIGNAVAVAGESNTIRIGNFLHTATYIAGISGQPAVGGDAVLITDDGKLGTVNFSSERFKQEIKPMDKASEAILALKPVTFRYKNEIDPKGIRQFGLVAEEVDKVSSDLVKRDANGEVYTVRYEAVNAMLLNEFIKEHRRGEEQDCKIQEQETTIAELKSEIRNLAAIVNEQASELRKVSAQLQISNAAVQAIASNSP